MSVATPACPFCDSRDVELVSAWGGQLLTSQLRCRHCNTHFEAVRDAFHPAQSVGDPLPDDASAPDMTT